MRKLVVLPLLGIGARCSGTPIQQGTAPASGAPSSFEASQRTEGGIGGLDGDAEASVKASPKGGVAAGLGAEGSRPDLQAVSEPAASSDAGVRTDRHGRTYPVQYACIVDLLEYLATRNEFRGVFDAKKTLALDIPRLLSRINPEGIVLKEDTPPATVREFSLRQIERQLRSRQGSAFIALVHLGTGVDPVCRTPNGASRLAESGPWQRHARNTPTSSNVTQCG